jgi:hypothetical protein
MNGTGSLSCPVTGFDLGGVEHSDSAIRLLQDALATWQRKWHIKAFRIIFAGQCRSGGLMVIVIATGPKVRSLKLGQGRWIFKGEKNP